MSQRLGVDACSESRFTAACFASTEWACPPAPNLPSCPPWIIARSACGVFLGDLGVFARDAFGLGPRDTTRAMLVSLSGRSESHAKTPSRKEILSDSLVLWEIPIHLV